MLLVLCYLFIQKERYVVTYNPFKGRIYALFRYQAKSDDILKATFHRFL
ncbi:Protein root UVB sensitive 6 [Orobanche minor]